MKRFVCMLVLAVATTGAPGSGWARADEVEKEESVEGLLDRLDDIERRRRAARPSTLQRSAPQTQTINRASDGGVGLALWALGVAFAIFAAALVVRLYRGRGAADEVPNGLQVEESIWIGRGQRILLIRVRGQELLVGATGAQLTSLAVLSGPQSVARAALKPASDDEEAPAKASKRVDAQRFANLVQDELTNAAAGGPLRSKKQILQRLNNL